MASITKVTPQSRYVARHGLFNGSIPAADDPFNFDTTLSWNDSFSGQTLSDWRNKVRSGLSATTPFSASKITVTDVPITYHYRGSVVAGSQDPTNWREREGTWSVADFLPQAIASNPIDAKVLNDAQTRWNKKIFDTVTAFQGGVFLIELQQTLRLVTNPAQSLRRALAEYLKLLKKRKFKGMRRVQIEKALAELWLEFVFGVRPLLSDIQAASELLDSKSDRLKLELVRVRAAVGPSWSTPTRLNGQNGTYGCAAWSFVRTRGAAAQYVGAVRSSCIPNRVLLDAAGFSPRNFLPTIWEVIPWSFVIDYFSNVGSVVESWSNQSLSFAWGSLTTKQFQTDYMDFCKPLEPGYAEYHIRNWNAGSYSAERKAVNRSIISSIPIPSVSYQIPGFGTKWINLAALAVARRELNFS